MSGRFQGLLFFMMSFVMITILARIVPIVYLTCIDPGTQNTYPRIRSIMKPKEFTVRQTIGGNYMRMQGKFSFKRRSDIKRDLPGIYKILLRITC